ncbi:MAG: hypothetical protein JJ974_12935 [Phycisphaerales bacterium]|nr:hypothetical protein [Phycisphaerales bacterium]
MTNESNNQSSNPDSTPKRRQGDRRKNKNGTPPPGTVIDRRLGLEHRAAGSPTTDSNNGKLVSSKKSGPKSASNETQQATGLERKRGRGRRLSEFTKSAEEGEMTPEQFLFLMAIDAFKKGNDRMFPTWTDVLEVVRLLGYRKTMSSELNLSNAEDWLESPHAPANVRPDRWAERFTTTEANELSVGAPQSKGPKTEKELTDEALEAFEAAFGEDDSAFDEFNDLDDDFSEAA